MQKIEINPPESDSIFPASYKHATLPLEHCVIFTIITPRTVAALNSAIISSRFDGTFPAPYDCKTTPSIGSCKKALTRSAVILGNSLSKPTFSQRVECT